MDAEVCSLILRICAVSTGRRLQGSLPLAAYCSFTSSELEAPISLVIATETDAMPVSTELPFGSVPWKVNGIEIVNCPPKACEAVPRNQAAAIC